MTTEQENTALGFCTDHQKESYAALKITHGEPVSVYYDHLCDYLAVQFKYIFIGVEKDGYAHS
jgi:hypothetical protein